MIDPNIFDFTNYLSAQLQVPTNAILVQPLSGGGTNFTVRACFNPSVFIDGAKLESIVLKYAPPFVASRPNERMSPYRQTIEARALSFLAGSLDHSDAKVIKLDNVLGKLQVPRFIRHDEAANVLWMSDLGGTKVMPEWLASPNTTPAQASRAGTELGRFLAGLFSATRNPSSDLVALFHNPYDRHDDVMPRNAATVVRCLNEIGATDAAELAERFKDSYADPEPADSCLGICDLWMGSILVDEAGAIALCDWEMFTRSEGGSELGMLLGSIRGLTLEPSTSHSTRQAATAFVNALLSSYALRTPSTCTSTFIRRLLLGYARELVCTEEELKDEVRVNAIKAWANVLRAIGPEEGQMDLGLIEEQDKRFLEQVLP